MRFITIADARRLQRATGADGVLILAFTADHVHGASYARRRRDCGPLGRELDRIMDEYIAGRKPAPCGRPV